MEGMKSAEMRLVSVTLGLLALIFTGEAQTDQRDRSPVSVDNGTRQVRLTGLAFACEDTPLIVEPNMSAVPSDCWGEVQMEVRVEDTESASANAGVEQRAMEAPAPSQFPELRLAEQFSQLIHSALYFMREQLPERIRLQSAQVSVKEKKTRDYGEQEPAELSVTQKDGSTARIRFRAMYRKNPLDLDENSFADFPRKPIKRQPASATDPGIAPGERQRPPSKRLEKGEPGSKRPAAY